MNSFPTRRTCLGILAASALCLGPTAHAQTYPTKPIQIIVPFPAGGATDTVARLLAEKMGPRLGQTIIVENKGGAAGILGTDTVAKAPADGHTLTVSLSTNLLTNQFLFKKLPYNPQRDLALVSQIAVAPIVLLVHPSVPASTGPELLKYIAANKGKVSYGSWGVGSAGHLSGAHMSKSQNAEMSHVAYKGEAPMITDLIGGQIQMAFASAHAGQAVRRRRQAQGHRRHRRAAHERAAQRANAGRAGPEGRRLPRHRLGRHGSARCDAAGGGAAPRR